MQKQLKHALDIIKIMQQAILVLSDNENVYGDTASISHKDIKSFIYEVEHDLK